MPTLSTVTAYLRDLAERVGATFVETFVAVLAASWTGVIPSDWRGWLTAAFFSAAAATIKGLVSKVAGDPSTASLLPSLITRTKAYTPPFNGDR